MRVNGFPDSPISDDPSRSLTVVAKPIGAGALTIEHDQVGTDAHGIAG